MLFELSEATGETTTLHTQSGLERMSLEEVPGRRSIRYSSVSGAVAPIENASVGAVLLAFSGEENRARTLAAIAEANPGFDRQTLEARLERTRRDGWAISIAERVPDATAITFRWRSEQLLLALSVMGPIERLTPTTLKRFVPGMQQVAERLVGVLDARAAAAAGPAVMRGFACSGALAVAEIAATAREAEELGYSCVWITVIRDVTDPVQVLEAALEADDHP